MALIVFRDLRGIAEVERLLAMEARGRLPEEEVEELRLVIDDTSRALFGITRNDTLYSALPDAVRARFDRAQWEAQFAILSDYARAPNAHWSRFGLDLSCQQGRAVHCLGWFGRELICAVDGLHPHAHLAFADREIARAA